MKQMSKMAPPVFRKSFGIFMFMFSSCVLVSLWSKNEVGLSLDFKLFALNPNSKVERSLNGLDNKHLELHQGITANGNRNSDGNKVTSSGNSLRFIQHGLNSSDYKMLSTTLPPILVDPKRIKEVELGLDEDVHSLEAYFRSITDTKAPILDDNNSKKTNKNGKTFQNAVEGALNYTFILQYTRADQPKYPDVDILGVIKPNRSYAVFSTTTNNSAAITFTYQLPLTALAWKRVGYHSVIILTGSKSELFNDPLYRYVIITLQRLEAILIFLDPKPENRVMISQVSRLFAATILHSTFSNTSGLDDIYLITSDSDLWPLARGIYELPNGFDLISLNSECCNPFTHKHRSHKMLPMANIGAKLRTWRALTEPVLGSEPTLMDAILSGFVREFGPVAAKPVQKGENAGWFMDQWMISILIEGWASKNNSVEGQKLKFVPRNTRSDRVDRNSWVVGKDLKGKVDSHLLHDTFVPKVWERVVPLIEIMYGNDTSDYRFCEQYHKQFLEFVNAKYGKQ